MKETFSRREETFRNSPPGYSHPQEMSLYYLQSRYYDPEVGRFLNADAFASTGQGILGANMFAYCLNNPVNSDDEKGNNSESIIIGVLHLLHDLLQFTRDDDERVTVTKGQHNGEPNIKINNSASVITPTAKFAYAFYLNYFSEYKDDIKGSTAGMVFEWEVHNVAYYGLQAAKVVGIDKPKLIDRARSVDLGPTIYNDNHPGIGNLMKAIYIVSNPVSALYDLLTYTEGWVRRSEQNAQ